MQERTEVRPRVTAIDGLRSIAIVAIVLYHISPGGVPGFAISPEIFFVISGYLITSNILRDLQQGRFSFKEFYARRILRLLPNAILLVFTTVLLWHLLLPSGLDKLTARHAVWSLFNLSNIYIWQNLGSYWDQSAEWSPLTHFWTLGIEEQFYLGFPFFLFLLFLFSWSRRFIRSCLLLLAVGSFALGVWATVTHPVFAFYFPLTRIWEFLVGALLAAFGVSMGGPPAPFSKRAALAGWLGMGLILFAFAFGRESMGVPGWIAAFPVLGTAFIIWSIVRGPSPVTRFFERTPCVFVGRISYSFYLWHWPFIVLAKYKASHYGLPVLPCVAAGAAASLLVCIAMFYLVEEPFHKSRRARIARLCAIGMAFAACFFYCYHISRKPFVDFSGSFNPIVSSWNVYSASKDNSANASREDVKFFDVRFVSRTADFLDKSHFNETGLLVHLYGNKQAEKLSPEHFNPEVMVWGTSHAIMYSKTIDDVCQKLGKSVAFAGKAQGDYLLDERYPEFSAIKRKWLRIWRPRVLFLIDYWDHYSPDYFKRKMTELVAQIHRLSPETQVVILAQVPCLPFGDKENLRVIVESLRGGADKPLPSLFPKGKRTSVEIHKIAEQISAGDKRVVFMRPDALFYNQNGSIRYADGKNFFYMDDDHLTDAGAWVTAPLFEEVLKTISNQPNGEREIGKGGKGG